MPSFQCILSVRSARFRAFQYHHGPVLSLAAASDSHYLFSCSEDKQLCCVDRRTWTPVAWRRFARNPMSLSLGDRQLWLADSGGRLHLIDPVANNLDLLGVRR